MYLDPAKYKGDMSYHERLHLFMKDTIRVKNILSTDVKLKYDSIYHTFKAGQTKDVERYLAIRFCQYICETVMNQMIAERGEKAKEELGKRDGNLLVDKYLENRQIWDKMPKHNDPELNRKIWSECWLGVVEKYGEDRDLPKQAQQGVDPKSSLYEKLSYEFKDVKLGEEAPQATPTEAFVVESPKASETPLASEVTVNDNQASS